MTAIPLENQIGELLHSKLLKLTFAESCTGGLVGHRITNVPGSSEYYLGSITTYTNQVKEHLLGVSIQTLRNHGAVSRECVLEMARGVRRVLRGDFPVDQVLGVSISGIAGPGGGSPDKPVGTVWIGMSTSNEDWAWQFHWQGDRIQNKELSAQAALQLVVWYLQGNIPAEDWSGDDIKTKHL